MSDDNMDIELLNEKDRVIHDNKVEWEYRMKWALNKLRNSGLIEKDFSISSSILTVICEG